MKKSKVSRIQNRLTRRSFLKNTSLMVLGGTLLNSASGEVNAASAVNAIEAEAGDLSLVQNAYKQRLLAGWEYYKGNLGSSWEVWRQVVDDTVKWQPVTLPHCFNATDAVDPDVSYYQGEGWYRTRLKLENPYVGGRTLLHFEGAGQKSDVYVFTQKVGTHVGGYDEFTADITEAAAKAVKDEKNKGLVPVTVRCDNARDSALIPSNMSDFNLYGGLYRYVNLVYAPRISLERVQIDSRIESKENAAVSIKAVLYNPEALKDEVQISVQILDPNGKAIHSFSKNFSSWNDLQELTNVTVKAPQLWSPNTPALYVCQVSIKTAHGGHQMTERFGLRFFEFVKQGPFKLNGEQLLIRGTQRHEDHAGLGAALTEEIMRRELTLVKKMGANFIRLGHYQQSRIALDLCDELGLLAWEEIPWCRGGLGDDVYKEQARRMLRNMINQHRNHPSVILWGLGNENDWPGDFEEFDKNKIRAFMSELNELSHTLDPTRQTAIRRCDFCSDIVDVYSPSIWAGWYRGRYTEYKPLTETEMKKVDHFLHMEWGGDSHARRHAETPDQILAKIDRGETDERGMDYLLTGGVERPSKDGDWSETYICNLFDWHLKEQETIPNLTGTAQWCFKDFSTPLRPENPVPRINQKGVVERDLTPKEGYYVFQSYWTQKPMIRIFGHSVPVRWGARDEPKMVKIYSNCPEVELFLNGVSIGKKRRNSQNFPAAGLRWPVKFKDGDNQLKAVGYKENTTVTDEIKFRYQTEKWDKPARFDLKEIERTGSIVKVQATLLDSRGITCLDARNFVRFALVGDGFLLDNLGTSTGSRKVELYNGRAVISLKLDGEAVVSLKSEKLPTAFLILK